MRYTVSLNENRDFRRLYRKGRSFVGSCVVVYFLKNRRNINRIGITTGKKLGKAVTRNRVKRIIREAYRSLEEDTKSGWDIVFVARSRATGLKTGEMFRAIRVLFSQAGVLKK